MATKLRAEVEDGRYNVRAVERSLRILNLLSDGKTRGLTDISDAIDLSASTTFRLLSTLAQHHYVERNEPAGLYRLGLACLTLARAFQAGSDVRKAALPIMEQLRDETTETVHLAVLDKMEVVYLEKLQGLHAVGLMSSRIGGHSPSYCTGVGKVLLAYCDPDQVQAYFAVHPFHRFTSNTVQSVEALMAELTCIRDRGYGFDRGEHEAEVRCVAAPIFDLDGKVVAAISVSGPANRMEPLEQQHDLILKTTKAVFTISTRLGYPDR